MNQRILCLRLCRLGILLLNRPLNVICLVFDLGLNDGSYDSDGKHVPEAFFNTVPLIYFIRILNEHLSALNLHQMLMLVHPFYLTKELCDGVAGLGRNHEAQFTLL